LTTSRGFQVTPPVEPVLSRVPKRLAFCVKVAVWISSPMMVQP